MVEARDDAQVRVDPDAHRQRSARQEARRIPSSGAICSSISDSINLKCQNAL
jgi:hypothetical protein